MSGKISRKQTRAIKALLKYPTIDQAAAEVGVNPRTVYRWLGDPGFRSGLSQAEGAALDLATRRLLLLADKAINALESVLDDPSQEGAGNKRLAAQAVLDHLLKLRELRSIEERLVNLELAVYDKTS